MAAANRAPIVVGISSNVLERFGRAARPDGIGVYTRELADALTSAGVQVLRIGAPMVVGARLARPREASLSFALPLSCMAAASALKVPAPTARAVARRIDVYHATDYLVPKLSRTPVVATIHDAIPLVNPAWANPSMRSLKNWLLRHSAQSADVVIAISEAAADELVQHYRIPRERIRIVPLGVHERWFKRPDDAVLQATLARHRLQPGYVLHVGTLQPRKNLGTLVSAYESLPQALREARQLVLVGKYGWGAPDLGRRLEDLKAGRRVVWLDYVSPDDLQALYYAAGMFAYPSLAEGFGLPLLEALACGLPVVASELPALRETAASHAHFVAPDRVDAIADAIIRVHESPADPSAVEQRRMRARRYDWAVCANKTLAIYEEVRR